MNKPFTAAQFTPTKWDTAEDKAKFANHFVRFVEGGFKESVFPKWFYRRLSMTFGHIAHYNKAGFYDQWFSTADRRIEFIENVRRSSIYGDPAWTYSDVEKVLQGWVRAKQSQLTAV